MNNESLYGYVFSVGLNHLQRQQKCSLLQSPPYSLNSEFTAVKSSVFRGETQIRASRNRPAQRQSADLRRRWRFGALGRGCFFNNSTESTGYLYRKRTLTPLSYQTHTHKKSTPGELQLKCESSNDRFFDKNVWTSSWPWSMQKFLKQETRTTNEPRWAKWSMLQLRASVYSKTFLRVWKGGPQSKRRF